MCPKLNGITQVIHTSSSFPERMRGLPLVTQEVDSGSEFRWLPWDQSLDYSYSLTLIQQHGACPEEVLKGEHRVDGLDQRSG